MSKPSDKHMHSKLPPVAIPRPSRSIPPLTPPAPTPLYPPLPQGRASLDSFRGLIFVGGFSYADVLDSAKGWAGERRGVDLLARKLVAYAGRVKGRVA